MEEGQWKGATHGLRTAQPLPVLGRSGVWGERVGSEGGIEGGRELGREGRLKEVEVWGRGLGRERSRLGMGVDAVAGADANLQRARRGVELASGNRQ
jgi:hypothetical protein